MLRLFMAGCTEAHGLGHTDRLADMVVFLFIERIIVYNTF